MRIANLIAPLFVVLAACEPATTPAPGSEAQSKPPTKVELLLDWKAEPTYAPFFIAKELGYYTEAGLDVTIVEGNGATTSAQVIGAGNQYRIGSNSGAATAIARSNGIPVKSVAVYYHQIPTVIYSRADTPIKKPEDLYGRTIGLIDGSITKDEYRGLVAANALDRSRIKEVSAGFEVAPLLSKQVDGLMNYAELTPVQLGLDGVKVETMRLSSFGVSAYSLNLIAQDSLIETNPELVRSVVAATDRGFDFVRNDPEKAAEIFSRLFPEKSADYVKASMKVVAEQLSGPAIGSQDREGWQKTITTLQDLGLLAKPVSVDEVMWPATAAQQ